MHNDTRIVITFQIATIFEEEILAKRAPSGKARARRVKKKQKNKTFFQKPLDKPKNICYNI